MVTNISIHDSVTNYSCHKKNINAFDILTFMQMRTVLTDKNRLTQMRTGKKRL